MLIQRPRHRRSGGAILELIIFMPVLLIFLTSTVEFGQIMSGLKVVELASRMAAKTAAESAQADLISGAALTAVESTANSTLAGYGMTSCRVILEHTLGGVGTFNTGACPCSAPVTPALPTSASGSVRVTVCVEATELTPDLLSTLGFTVVGKHGQQSTVLPVETP